MANDIQSKNVNIYIDDAPARDAYERLSKKADEYNKRIDEGTRKSEILSKQLQVALDAGGKPETLKKKLAEVNASLDKNKQELAKVTDQQKALQEQIDSKSGPSLKQQETLVTKLWNEYKNLGFNTEEAEKKLLEYTQASANLNVMRDRINEVKAAQENATKSTSATGAAVGKASEAYSTLKGHILDMIPGGNQLHEVYTKVGSVFSSSKQVLTSYANGVNTVKKAQAEAAETSKATAAAEKARAIATEGATVATEAGSTALKIFRVALLSTGIGAIVVLLSSLIAYLTGTQEGIDKLTKVTRPLQAIFTALQNTLEDIGQFLTSTFSNAIKHPIDALKSLGNAILENLINRFKAVSVFAGGIGKILSGEFKEGFKELGNAGIQFATGVTDGIDKMGQAADKAKGIMKDAIAYGQEQDRLQKEIEKRDIEIIRRQGDLNRAIAEQSEIAKDASKSENERAAAAKKATEAINEKYRLENGLLDLKIKKKTEEAKFDDQNREIEKEIAELEAEKKNNEAEAANQRIGLKRVLNKLDKADQKDLDEALKGAEVLNKKFRDLAAEAEAASQSQDEKEIEAIKHKYEEFYREYDAYIKKVGKNKPKLAFSRDDISVKEQAELDAKLKEQEKKQADESAKVAIAAIEKKYAEAQQQSELFYKGQAKLQAEAFTRGEIDDKQYQANLAAIDLKASENKLQIARDYAGQKITINGKEVALVKQADDDLTKGLKENLDKQVADKLAAYAKEQQFRQLMQNMEEQSAVSHAQALVTLAKTPGEKLKAALGLIEVQHTQARDRMAKEQEDLIKAAGNDQEQIAEIQKRYAQKRKDDQALQDKEETDAKRQKVLDEINIGLELAQASLDVYTKFLDQKAQKENAALDRELKQNDARKAADKRLLDNKLISQQEYSKRIAEIDAAADKKKHELQVKQFERNKKLQLSQAFINLATGATRTIQEWGFPLAIPFLAAEAIAGGLEIANILKQKPPEFEKGGIAQGSRHSEGGISMIDSRTGRKVGEMEDGEPYMILSRNTYKNNKQVIDALLESSTQRNGAKIDPWFRTRPYKRFDYGGVTRTIQNVRYYASGGVFQQQKAEAPAADPQPVIVPAISPEQESLMKEMLQYLKTPKKSYVVLSDIQAAGDQLDAIQSEATFK